jgi:phosphoglycerate dehydrogenase-like enzyme
MIQLGQGIGMRVLAWTVHPSPQRAAKYGVEYVSLEKLLQDSDVVSLHVELTAITEKFIGPEQLSLMKPTAILVNTARGAVVDERALIEALAEGRIAGAGLDVFETEPLPPGHPLTRLENVVMTSHRAIMSHNAVSRAFEMVVEALESFASGSTIYTVNAR